MEAIDRKYRFTAVGLASGRKYTHANAVVFLAKDALLPDLLDAYHALCLKAGVDERQIKGIQLLKGRVLIYQRRNLAKVKVPGVNEGKEEKRICKPNKYKGGLLREW